jgi:hypothetical protein
MLLPDALGLISADAEFAYLAETPFSFIVPMHQDQLDVLLDPGVGFAGVSEKTNTPPPDTA